jgi:1-acyl-sn-glycerol-3-phosphate acyltransferase
MNKFQEKFYMGVQWAFKGLVDQGVSIRVEGLENFPREGPAVLVCNHRSDLDPFLLAFHIPRPVHWMARAFLFNIPLFRELLWAVDAIPINRKPEVRQKALDKGAEILKGGGVVGIFPEGIDAIGDPETEHLHTFHTGFARMALANHAPVVPAAIIPEEQSLEPVPIPEWLRKMWGFEGRMGEFEKHVVYRKARLLIGEPIRFEGPINYRSLKIVATQTREVIYHMITEGAHPPKRKAAKKKAAAAKAAPPAKGGRARRSKASAAPSPRELVIEARRKRNGGAAPAAQPVPKVRKLPARQWPVAPMPGAPVEE